MWALITGASSGIGRDMARYLYKMNYNLILVARNEKALYSLKEDLENNDENDKNKIMVIPEDLSNEKNCKELYEKTKNLNPDIVINNAGFGVFGEFSETDLNTELDLINTNIVAVHILTKLFL